MISIEPMTENNWTEVRNIYQEGIETGMATFETEAPDWHHWNENHFPHSRLLAKNKNDIIGWAALSPVSDRCVYGGVAEVSIYITEKARGQGIGTKLLNALVEESEENGIWTLQAGLFAGNKASVKLHTKCGFRIVGLRKKLGKLNGRWRDVLLLERSSELMRD